MQFLGMPLLMFSLTVAAAIPARSDVPQEPSHRVDEKEPQDLLELLSTHVVSASKTRERLSDVPATMIVLKREELLKRGYTEVSQILDDLPGMQVIRPFGDAQLKNYWRGYRSFIGEPFQFLVDGLVQNGLYYNMAETPLVTVPVSNIERIEIVYGPASSVYGANAAMGVINVITLKGPTESGNNTWVKMGAGSNGLRYADASYGFEENRLRLCATFRFENSVMDSSTSEAYEYTKQRYYGDRALWGAFVDNPSLGGRNYSQNQKRGLDLRAYWGELELGLQRYDLRSGYGNEYAADLVQNAPLWHRRETSMHLRHTQSFSERLSGTTLLRYRESDIPGDSAFVDAGPYAVGGAYGAAFSFWQTQNNSLSLLQDFDWKALPSLSVNMGFKYEQKDLQKAYDNPYGPYQAATSTDAYPFPAPPNAAAQIQNRIQVEDRGVYAQLRWRLNEANSLILGGRRDYSSTYKNADTLRLGYVGNFGRISVKAMFGQAFQEPVPRLLYGGWRGSGSDPRLGPEKSDTLEFSAGYTGRIASLTASCWNTRDRNVILGGVGSARNLGDRTLRGLDLHLQARSDVPWGGNLNAWASVSYLFRNSGTNNPDSSVPTSEGLTPDGRVGDLAKLQVKAGATLDFRFNLSFTLLARYVGPRDTVATNPVGQVDGYCVADLVLYAKALFAPSFGLTLKLSNLTDKTYFHPGISQGNAGLTPGRFLGTPGAWVGSGGYYSSLLAQPGREIQMALTLRF